jgi:hypothetical protein
MAVSAHRTAAPGSCMMALMQSFVAGYLCRAARGEAHGKSSSSALPDLEIHAGFGDTGAAP